DQLDRRRPEERSQLMKVGLRSAVNVFTRADVDIAQLVVVTLETIDSHAEESSCRPAGQANRIRLIVGGWVGGRCNKIRRRLAGPDSLVREQLAHDLVVRRVLRKLVAEPQSKAAAAKEDDVPLL